MFYYPNVLHRHTGCFSTIWLAATRGIRVTRRELLKVNIKRTCGNIVDYVTARVLPPQPNLPKPRFSLYLSSQLQYGVVVVYHRQCSFLLEEVQQTIDRLLRSNRCLRIDMVECDRLALDVPDGLYMRGEAEGAQDPFFGVMESYQLPSPYKIQQLMPVSEEASVQNSLVPSPHNTPDKDGFQTPPAAITLTEKEGLSPTSAEYFEGADLPEATTREIDLLMDQPDHFRGEMEGQHTGERGREPDGAMSFVDQLAETVLGAEQDTLWLLDKESGLHTEVPLEAADLEMTPAKLALPTPPSGESEKKGDRANLNEEVVVPPIRKSSRGRGRQLVFFDPEVQITDRAMKEQIRNPLAETQAMSKVMPDLPALTKHATPAQLFTTPCGPLLSANLQSIWKQSAMLTVLTGGEEEEDTESTLVSEQDREILRTERKRKYSSTMEISSESGLQLTEGSSPLEVILDMSKEDRSVSDAITPVSRWSPQVEVQQLPMEPIAEENIEMPEAHTDTEIKDMLSWISSCLQKFGQLTFGSLLPPEANRSAAAQTLYKLLELLSAREVTVQQTEPYGSISINATSIRMTA